MGGQWNYEPDFQGCLDIEAAGCRLFEKYLVGGDWIPLRISNSVVQQSGIDYILKCDNKELSVELKTEEADKYGNLFLETISNSRPFRPGWLLTCQADYLVYIFVNDQTLYIIDFPILNQWYWNNINRFEIKQQRKYHQHNQAFGVPVPISVITAEVGAKVANLV